MKVMKRTVASAAVVAPWTGKSAAIERDRRRRWGSESGRMNELPRAIHKLPGTMSACAHIRTHPAVVYSTETLLSIPRVRRGNAPENYCRARNRPTEWRYNNITRSKTNGRTVKRYRLGIKICTMRPYGSAGTDNGIPTDDQYIYLCTWLKRDRPVWSRKVAQIDSTRTLDENAGLWRVVVRPETYLSTFVSSHG